MKILYALQATGNGHIMRAKQHIPLLKEKAEVDILQSGNLSEIDLGFEIKYKFKGLSFQYNDKGGISFFKTALNMSFLQFFKDVKSLDLSQYDFIISDFEPVSAWACKRQKKMCISSSHQFSFKSDKTPRPKIKDIISEIIFKKYAPSAIGLGFHYKSYEKFILEPNIRAEIKDADIQNNKHYVVYLSAYKNDFIFNVLSKFPDKTFYIFGRETKESYSIKNINFLPVNTEDFTAKLISCEGIITAGGFETTSEALYLGKKMLVIPITGQYEQECNVEALNQDFKSCLTSTKLDLKSVQKLIDSEIPARIFFNLRNQYNYVDKVFKLYSFFRSKFI